MMTKGFLLAGALVAAVGAAAALAQAPSDSPPPVDKAAETPPAADPASRRAFFGELHLHTTMSFDAWTFGTKVTPDQAYKFARGETVMVPAVQVAKEQGIPANRPVAGQTRLAARLHRGHRPLRIPGRDAISSTIRTAPSPDPARRSSSRRAACGAFFAAAAAIFGPAERSHARPEGGGVGRRRLGRRDEGRQRQLPAGQVHHLRRLRVDRLAGRRRAHAPQRDLQRRSRARRRSPPSIPTSPKTSGSIWTRCAGRASTCIAIPHNSNLSDGHDFDWNMSERPPDRRGLRPATRAQRAAGGDRPDQGHIGHHAGAVAQRRVRQLRDHGPHLQGRDHGQPARLLRARGLWPRPGDPVQGRRQPVQDGHRRRLRHPQWPHRQRRERLRRRLQRPRSEDHAADRARPPERPSTWAASARSVRPNGQRENDPLQFSRAGDHRRLGRREHARLDLRGPEAQGDLRHLGHPHPGAHVRRLGLRPRTLQQRRDWVASAYAEGVPMGGDLPARPASAAARRASCCRP